MKAFADLYAELDASTSTLHKVDALERYLRGAAPADAAWAVYVLAGGKPRQAVASRLMREAAREAAGLPEWLFDESYQAVGDLAETIAHLLPPATTLEVVGLAEWMTRRLPSLRGAPPEDAKAALRGWWSALDWNGRFVLSKLITGGFRVGVSKLLVMRAVARVAGLDEKLLAQRMIGYTDARASPDAARWLALIAPADAAEPAAATAGHPYPFFLAHPLQQPPESLGAPGDWLVEWKWDGIRAQLVLRAGGAWLWSRGEELITERFPEIERAARAFAASVAPAGEGLVLDGEVLAWDPQAVRPMPFAALQKRVARKTLTPAVLRASPAAFVAYDLLEWRGEDWRPRPQAERRAMLESLLEAAAVPGLSLSPRVVADDWAGFAALREASRARGVEGFMLKRLASAYGVGRTKVDGGDWWKWKVEPFSVDAVLVYAQRGHGRRASLYTDYTFAVWDRAVDAAGGPSDPPRALLPFAKAYSGLTDEEIRRVDAIVRRTTVEKFGPVRSVTPTLVFELGFEAIARSPRHKSGIAVRFPRMLRWRTDKPVGEADTIEALRALLPPG
ncbi:MAG: ATP-dependent DNA ligase [Burkholderiaceae bacterium]|nr:ATP-dependent DNA ligase [Burkholderiales bacterium]MCZ8339766.1 ATP-dependent DNA ligase [Burkholderiaceae bacterium]